VSSRCVEAARQRGVALITVLLVFALVTMMASQMMHSSYLAIQRTGNLVESTQARYYALGAEELGRQLLEQDGKALGAGGGVDHLREGWAAENLSFEIEDGKIELLVQDLAGRFNLNGLVDGKGKADPLAVARFGRLLRILEVEPALAQAAADWVDTDSETFRGGSEAAAYGAVLPNQPFVSPDELRTLPGVDAEAWARLAPHLAALPTGTRLNVNTATAEVLAAYASGPGATQVERFVHARELQPIRDAQDPALANLFAESREALDVKSSFFEFQAHAEYRGRHVRFTTRVQRDARTGKISILGRGDAARL
jgi:general secretion pathway protein K